MKADLPPLPARIAAALAVLGFFVFGATHGSLANSTDSIYAIVASDIAERGHWLTPEVAGGPYLMKPPLYFWSVAVALKAFGATALSFRLPGILSGWAVSLLCAGIAARVGGRRLGWFLGLGAVLLSPTVFEFSRRIFMEETLGAAMLLALYGAIRADQEDDVRWLWLVGPASAVALLTKSYGGGFAGVAILLWLPLVGRARWMLSRPFLLGIALGAVPIVAYVLVMLKVAPEPFIHQNLLPFRMGSAAQFSWYRTGRFFYFTEPLKTDAIVFVGGGVGLLLGALRGRADRSLRGLWLLGIYVAVGYTVWGSLSQQRLYYLVPFLPAFACALAVALLRWVPPGPARIVAGAMFLAAPAVQAPLFSADKLDPESALAALGPQVASAVPQGEVVYRYNDFFAATELYTDHRAIGLTPSQELLTDFGRILVLGERDIARDGRPPALFELFWGEHDAGHPIHLIADEHALGLILPGTPGLLPRASALGADGQRLWFASTGSSLPPVEGPAPLRGGYPVALRWLADHRMQDLEGVALDAQGRFGEAGLAELMTEAGLPLPGVTVERPADPRPAGAPEP